MMKPGVLIVSNFLSHVTGIRSVGEELSDRLENDGWRVVRTSNRLAKFARLLDMITTAWRERKSYSCAAVEVYSGPAFLWAEAVCATLKALKKPIIMTLHGGNLPEYGLKHPQRVRRLLGTAAVVTAPSRYLLGHMKPYYSNILLLPNPIDVSVYDYRCRNTPSPHLIWLRAFHSIYNPVLGPRVLMNLKSDIANIRLTMVGPDKGDGSLLLTQQAAEKFGVIDLLCLPGGVPKKEVATWLNKGDIFLNTTNIDNTPISVLEAMASGLCVVSTNVGGLPYLLDHESDALLVPPDDPDAMAAAIRRILTEPGLAERLSRNARNKAEQYDWAIVLARWDSLLRQVAHG